MCGKGLHELPWCSELCNSFSSLEAFSQVISSPCPQYPKAHVLMERLSPNRGTVTHGINIVTASNGQQTMNIQDLQWFLSMFDSSDGIIP